MNVDYPHNQKPIDAITPISAVIQRFGGERAGVVLIAEARLIGGLQTRVGLTVVAAREQLLFVDAEFCSKLSIEVVDDGLALVSDEHGNDPAARGHAAVGFNRGPQLLPGPQVRVLVVLARPRPGEARR